MSKVSKGHLFKLILGFIYTIWIVSCQHSKNPAYSPSIGSAKIKVNSNFSRANKPIEVGEELEIFVAEDPSFNGVYKIRERGDIILPKLGRVSVAGLSVDQAQARISQELQGSQLKKASVIADRVGPIVPAAFDETPKLLMYITGKVNRPGQHLIAIAKPGSVFAYEALLIAGGVAPFGDEHNAYILRRDLGGNRTRIPFDIRSIRQGKSNDIPLEEGDMICVPERRFSL